MEMLENLVATIDYILNTKRKRHIVGGVMLSVSMLFGGLVLTIMTVKEGVNHE